jgi:serine O-acetyltransferase
MRQAEKLLYKSTYLYKKNKKRLADFYRILARLIFSFEFSSSVSIGENLQLVHNGLGVVLHPKATIKNNCKIYQHVTIGGNAKIINNTVYNQGAPTIENNVSIFTGAVVVGPIFIGENSIVAANTVVTKDVPPNSIAFGNPAKIKPKDFEYNYGKKD